MEKEVRELMLKSLIREFDFAVPNPIGIYGYDSSFREEVSEMVRGNYGVNVLDGNISMVYSVDLDSVYNRCRRNIEKKRGF